MDSQSTDTSAPLLALAATRAEDSAGSAAQSDLASLLDLGLEPLVDFGDGNEAHEVHADPGNWRTWIEKAVWVDFVGSTDWVDFSPPGFGVGEFKN